MYRRWIACGTLALALSACGALPGAPAATTAPAASTVGTAPTSAPAAASPATAPTELPAATTGSAPTIAVVTTAPLTTGNATNTPAAATGSAATAAPVPTGSAATAARAGTPTSATNNALATADAQAQATLTALGTPVTGTGGRQTTPTASTGAATTPAATSAAGTPSASGTGQQVQLFESKVSFTLPPGLSEMPDDLKRTKYSRGNVPQYAYSDESAATSIAVTRSTGTVKPTQLEEFRKVVEQAIEQSTPGINWITRDLTTINGRQWARLVFISKAIDTDIRNEVYMTSFEDTPLLFNFNVTVGKYEAQRAGLEASRDSITIK